MGTLLVTQLWEPLNGKVISRWRLSSPSPLVSPVLMESKPSFPAVYLPQRCVSIPHANSFFIGKLSGDIRYNIYPKVFLSSVDELSTVSSFSCKSPFHAQFSCMCAPIRGVANLQVCLRYAGVVYL